MKENTVAWHIYQAIKTGIVNGEYSDLSDFTELGLAEEYGVSRTPIRVAFKQLEQDGLLDLLPGRGVRIRKVETNEVEQIFTIREALEGISAKNAATIISESNIKLLWEKYFQSESFLIQGNLHEFTAVGQEIHSIIIRVTKNSYLQQIITNVGLSTMRFQKAAAELPGRAEQSHKEHFEIVQAIASHDPELAEKCMRAHIASAKDSLIIAFKNEIC